MLELFFRAAARARFDLFFVLAFLFVTRLYANSLELPPPVQQSLESLNNGRLLEAYDDLKKLTKESPDSPAALFVFAMTKYRMMSLADYTNADKTELEASMDKLEEICEPKIENNNDALFYYAAIQGVRAQWTGLQGDWWATAKLGKKMKHSAEVLIERAPDYEEARYLLGSYNYFADALPGYIKFLRALAFLPGGDRTTGMKQLIGTYQKQTVTSMEAGRTLAYIYTYFEDRPDYGVRMCDNILGQCPDAFDIGTYKGIDLYFSSEFGKAQDWLTHLKAEIHAYSHLHGGSEDKVVPVYFRQEREVRYWIARSLLRQKRLDEAEKILLELKTPELHEPFWIQRGVSLSLAEIYYARKKPEQAESIIDRVLEWSDVKDSHEKAKLLKKKKGDVKPFDMDLK